TPLAVGTVASGTIRCVAIMPSTASSRTRSSASMRAGSEDQGAWRRRAGASAVVMPPGFPATAAARVSSRSHGPSSAAPLRLHPGWERGRCPGSAHAVGEVRRFAGLDALAEVDPVSRREAQFGAGADALDALVEAEDACSAQVMLLG